MRTLPALLMLPLLAAAQTPTGAPAALLRGVLVERDAPGPSGEFSVRTAGNQVFHFQFDDKTYVEREGRMIDVARLQPGEKVEVLSDNVAGVALRYARTLHVVEDPPPPRPLTMGRVRAYRSAADRVIPAGTLTFSGVVFKLSAGQLVLHTREGDQMLLLRPDTRYLENGELVEPAALHIHTRVFVRAGKDLNDQTEAYQVVWGKILDPQ